MTRRELEEWFCRQVAARLGIESDQVDLTEPFAALGIDSVALASLAAGAQDVIGRPLDPTVLFEYPSIAELAAHLAGGGSRPAKGGPRVPAGQREPVAIVGLACRVPGARSVDELWSLLIEGRSSVGIVPEGRWPVKVGSVPGTPRDEAIRFGGFLDDLAGFDAEFFRIPADEAARLDPQHRLLLELTWEALEDAGITPGSVSGTRAGVFVGISANEYARRQVDEAARISALTPTANALSVAANRISYFYDFRGPSMAVDTACSSSLVATHIAVRSLRGGEADLAIVAGVNLLLEPEVSIALARAGMLAEDGTCRAFDAGASGYVRSEGCLVIVLKPLAAALADDDRVYAVIRGSATNQDGRSNGLTAPNPRAQAEVLAAAYADAGTAPGSVGYVECHGTGTPLGDPVEVRALGEVLGPDRAAPCSIGSVKTNLGHLESAAGLAGLMKAVLAIHHGELPPTVNYTVPNPHIPFDDLNMAVASDRRPWPPGERIAGVSSFGFGGTNAHVVLAEPPAREAPPDAGGPVVLPVSAAHPDGVIERASGLAKLLRRDDSSLYSVAATMAHRREHHRYRIAVAGTSAREVAGLLDGAARRTPEPAVDDLGVAFVFSGFSDLDAVVPQLVASPDRLCRSLLRRCDEIVGDLAGWSLLEAFDQAAHGALKSVERAQPAYVAAQIVLSSRWEAVGIRPSVVVGHSVGEVGAAYVAGALSLEQAMKVAVIRGSAIAGTVGRGRMLVVGQGEQTARLVIGELGADAHIAVVNSPGSTVLSGDAASLDLVRRRCVDEGWFSSWVPVEFASHCPAVADAAERLRRELGDLCPASPTTPMVSAVTGAFLVDPPGGAYWASNLREPVRFADAARVALATAAACVEVAPLPALRTPITELARDLDRDDFAVVPSSDRSLPLDHVRAAGVARLYELGAPVRWDAVIGHRPPVTAPGYPWRKKHHWYERQPMRRSLGPAGSLLGARVDMPGPQHRWERLVLDDDTRWLLDHRVEGAAVMPAAGFVAVMMEAASAVGIVPSARIADIRFRDPLAIEAHRVMHSVLAPAPEGYEVEIYSRRAPEKPWTLHVTARLRASDTAQEARADLAGARGRCLETLAPESCYAILASHGLDYGHAFRGLQDVWVGPGEVTGTVRAGVSSVRGYEPTLIDSALQMTAFAAGTTSGQATAVRAVPVAIDSVSWRGLPSATARVVASATSPPGELVRADVTLVADDGTPMVEVRGLRLREGRLRSYQAAGAGRSVYAYEVAWRERPPRDAEPHAGRIAVVGTGPIAEALAEMAGEGTALVAPGSPGIDEFFLASGPTVPPTDIVLAIEPPFCSSPEGAAASCAASVAQAAVSLQRAPHLAGTRLWLVTTRTHALVTPAENPACAAAWGVARALAFEDPALELRCVDIGGTADLAGLLADLRDPSDEAEIAWRGGVRYVRRLTAVALPDGPGSLPLVDPKAAYLISGGLGDIGLVVARWLAAQGAEQIILMSRHVPRDAPELAEVVKGCEVVAMAGDVADPEAVASCLSLIGPSRRLAGVVHAAGVLADAPIARVDKETFEAVARSKVGGAARLLESAGARDLDWFVAFSSAAAVVGSPGQAAYCAANAAMDAVTALAAGQGQPARTINWGPWARGGLAARTDSSQQWRHATAFAGIDPDAGVAALGSILAAGWRELMVVPFDFADLVRFYPRRLGLPLFDELSDARASAFTSDPGAGAASARPDLATGYVAPRNNLEALVARMWQDSLGFAQVGVNDGFFELGGDSVLGNQVIIDIGRSLGVTIDPEKAFDNFTVAHLVKLAEEAMTAMLGSMTDEQAAELFNQVENG